MKHLETHRLILRPMQTTDLDVYARLLGDPVVTKWIGGPRSYEEMSQKIVADAATWELYGYGRFVIERKSDHTPIGMCGVWKSSIEEFHFDEVGYAIFADFWNQGYTTEALSAVVNFAEKTAGLKLLYAVVSPENTYSKVALQRQGFVFERFIDRLKFKNAELWRWDA